MTPLEIQICIHYYACAGDYDNLDAPAVKDACDRFVELGVLFKADRLGRVYTGNDELLKVYVSALQKIPFPVRKYVIDDKD